MIELLAQELKNKGFGIRTYNNALLVYLKTRNTSRIEVVQALGPVSELIKMRPACDPRRYNRKGILITL